MNTMRRNSVSLFRTAAGVVWIFGGLIPGSTIAQDVELIVRVDPASAVHSSLETNEQNNRRQGTLPWSYVGTVRKVVPTRTAFAKSADDIVAFVVSIPDSVNVLDAQSAWERVSGVRYVQVNHRYQVDGAETAEIQRTVQGDPLADSLAHLAVVNVREAWQITRGDPAVRVGFVDTGAYFDHPDLAEAFWINPGEDLNANGRFDASDVNGIDDDGNGWIDDVRGYDFVDRPQSVEAGDYRLRDFDAFDDGSGHGTTVAGVLAARADNDLGITGLAPDVSIVALRGFGADGRGDDDDIAAAIIYAANMGLDVINLSFGDSYYSPLMHEAIRYAVNLGTVVVASAGNVGGDDPHYPSDYPEVISTVWLTEDGSGPAGRATFGSGIDVGAPGSFVFTTLQPDDDAAVPATDSDLYGRQSGSSLSAPMVSAAAALARSVNHSISPAGVRNAIVGTAIDIGELGWDHRTGSGLLNIGAALKRALPSRVEISSPDLNGGSVAGDIAIVGSVLHPALVEYSLDFAFGEDVLREADFLPIIAPQTGQVVRDTLGVWTTTGLTEGPYTIRLRAVLLSGQTIEDRRRFFLDATPPSITIKSQYQAFSRGRPAFFIDLESDDLVTVTLFVSQTGRDTTRVQSDRVARRHGLVITDDHFDALSGAGVIVITNRSGLQSFAAVSVSYPDGVPNDALFERETLPLRHGFLYTSTTDFDRDGLREIVYNSYVDGQLGDTVRVAEYPAWSEEGLIFSNVFPRDVGDTNSDGRMEILGQVSGATILFESASPAGVPVQPIFVDTTGLENPSSSESLWGARLHDTDGDGQGEIIGHNMAEYRIIERSAGMFAQSAELTNPTQSLNTELSSNGLAQPEVLVADLDGDGRTDILFGDTDGDWILWEATGNDQYALRWTLETDRYNAGRQFASGTSEVAGRPWFASSTTNWLGQRIDREHEPDATVVSVFQADADDSYRSVMTFALPGEIDSHSTLAAFDVDDNGVDELVIVAAPELYIVDVTGPSADLLYYTDELEDDTASPQGIRSAKVVSDDVDNDGVNDLVVATASGRLELWRTTLASGTRPALLTGAYALDASRVFLQWVAPASDSVSVLFRSGAGGFDIDTTVVGATATILRSSPGEYAIEAWKAGIASPLSRVVYIRPHEPARLQDVGVLSERQVVLNFDVPLGVLGPTAGFWPRTADTEIRALVQGKSVVLGFDYPIADSISWSGLVDLEGTPVADTVTWIDTRSMSDGEKLILSSWTLEAPRSVFLTFSAPVTVASATNVDNYAVTPFGRVENVAPIDEGGRRFAVAIAGLAVGATGLEAYLKVSNVWGLDGSRLSDEGSQISLSRTSEDLSGAYVFPNPTGPSNDRATIAGLPRGAQVDVFSSDGVRLRSLTELDGNGGLDWDLMDDRGALVPSGVYLLRVSSDGSSPVILKAAVIR